MKFQEWFNKNLVVGSFPIMNNENFSASKYDVIINVSDEFYPKILKILNSQNILSELHWFPMNECKKDVGLNSVYGAMVVLFVAEKQNKKVYLHCHAGVNRSKCVQAAYYFMRTGKQLELETNGYINRFVAMCSRGYLPPKTEAEKFITEVGKQLRANNMTGGILDHCKLETINDF